METNSFSFCKQLREKTTIKITQRFTYGVTSRSKRNVGHVVLRDELSRVQHRQLQTFTRYAEGDVGAGVVHVGLLGQHPHHSPLHLPLFVGSLKTSSFTYPVDALPGKIVKCRHVRHIQNLVSRESVYSLGNH
jgi:hypothetical protein